jgi:tRNA threonylcarbamoyl adenosine modification protein YjeE
MLTATKSSRINISEEGKTKSIAEAFSKNVKRGDALFFYGELGVGKTTFIKYLINFLQKKNNQIITEIPSPTFNLINEYHLDSIIIKHCDLYRIIDERELDNLGIFENINDQITLIEWPDIIKNYKIENKIELFFEYDADYKKRFISVSSTSNISFLNEFK